MKSVFISALLASFRVYLRAARGVVGSDGKSRRSMRNESLTVRLAVSNNFSKLRPLAPFQTWTLKTDRQAQEMRQGCSCRLENASCFIALLTCCLNIHSLSNLATFHTSYFTQPPCASPAPSLTAHGKYIRAEHRTKTQQTRLTFARSYRQWSPDHQLESRT